MDWKIEPYRDIFKLEFTDDLKAGDKRYVLLTSDWHFDHAQCDRQLLYNHLKKAQELNAPVFVIGDLFCAMQSREDKRRSMAALREELAVDEYIDALIDRTAESLHPYKENLALISKGNHETSFTKRQGIDLTKNLVRRLDGNILVGGYGGYVKFVFNYQTTKKKSIMYKFFHGSGGGGVVTKGVIQTNRRSSFIHSADIIHTGHVHEAWVLTTQRELCSNTGKISHSPQWHITTPTYKDEYQKGTEGWHVEGGRPPKPLGCAWLEFEVTGHDVGVKAWLDLKN